MDKTVAPDSVNVAILTIQPRATEAETKAYADSLVKILNGGAKFAEIAGQYSMDQFAKTGGEVGWMTEAGALQMVNNEFKNTVFSIPVGQSAVVKSNANVHIVKVSEKTNSVVKYKIADIEYTVTPSSATRNTLYTNLNSYIATNNTIEKLEKSAKESEFDLVLNARIFTSDVQVGAVGGARQVVRWAFNGKKGQISDIIECANHFVIAANKGIFPQGYQSLASVEPQLKSILAAKKKGEEIANNLKAKNYTSISDYASAMDREVDTVRFILMNTPYITNIGFEPKLNAYINYSPLNKVSEPIVGENGVYVFEVINRTNSEVPYDQKKEISKLESESNYRIGGMAMRVLQDKAKIKDNRVRFY
jgi:peptidyl-prolyl cis-trans isomerase D